MKKYKNHKGDSIYKGRPFIAKSPDDTLSDDAECNFTASMWAGKTDEHLATYGVTVEVIPPDPAVVIANQIAMIKETAREEIVREYTQTDQLNAIKDAASALFNAVMPLIVAADTSIVSQDKKDAAIAGATGLSAMVESINTKIATAKAEREAIEAHS